jgi:glycosyltransferase involved in cell wall biosynthesis
MKLSLIIPFYQNKEALSSCLASLAKQTVFSLFDREVEVIVVDDGSFSSCHPEEPSKSEATRDLVDEISRRFAPRNDIVKKYKIPHSGAPAARNFGFQKSSGEYVFFCDADVIFLKNDALEKMIKILDENPNKAFCYSQFKFGWKKFSCREFNAEELKKNNYIPTMSLVRREWLKKISPDKPWDENLKKFQDWDLWLSIVEQGGEGIFIPEYLWGSKSGGTMSSWLPSFFYKIFKNNNRVKKYEEAKTIIMKKHNLG